MMERLFNVFTKSSEGY